MGKIITCIGEENTGVTTTALMLSKTLSSLLNKKVLLVDLNYKKPDIHKVLSGEVYSKFNIDIVMNYAISESNLEVAVTTNVEKLNNSKMEVLMGTNAKRDYDPEQYINFFNQVVKMYDFVVIDTIVGKIPQVVTDYSNDILFIVDQSKKNLSNIATKYWKTLKSDKVEIVVNRYEKGVLDDKKIAEILEKKVSYKVNYDKSIIKYLNNKELTLEDTEYTDCIEKVAKTLIKRYGLEVKKKGFKISNLFKIRGGNNNG